MKSIAGRLFLGFLCMTALTAGILWLVQAGIMGDSYLNERIRAVDRAVADAAGDPPIDFPGLEESLNARFLMLGADGSVAYISQGMPMRGMVVNACRGMAAEDGRDGVCYIPEAADPSYAVLGRDLPSGGALYAVFALSDVREAARILRKQLWIVTAALAAASVALAAALSRAFSRPIREITGAARALAEGRYDVRLSVRSRDEIGQLTVALNELGEELSKTEALRRELIANVSHELRAPLSILQGYAETVRDVTWPHADKRTAQLNAIIEETKRLNRIVSDMLDYSRLRSGVETARPSVFPACEALAELAGRHGLEAEARNLSIDIRCGAGDIRFDRVRFGRVVDNLLVNALRFADPGTRIAVAAESRDGDCARIVIRNSGPAIPPEDLPHIWDRYYRAGTPDAGRAAGAGLGLAIVKSILEMHGVAYGVRSAGGETEFWFDTQPV